MSLGVQVTKLVLHLFESGEISAVRGGGSTERISERVIGMRHIFRSDTVRYCCRYLFAPTIPNCPILCRWLNVHLQPFDFSPHTLVPRIICPCKQVSFTLRGSWVAQHKVALPMASGISIVLLSIYYCFSRYALDAGEPN